MAAGATFGTGVRDFGTGVRDLGVVAAGGDFTGCRVLLFTGVSRLVGVVFPGVDRDLIGSKVGAAACGFGECTTVYFTVGLV